MLVEISIADFVLIERATLELGPGFTVVTGATGDGKTLFLRALRFVLGERAAGERLIRPPAERAVVEALFQIEDEALRAELRELGVPDEWEGPELVLSRSVDAAGRTKVRIGGRLASVAELRQIGERLVDVLSQHEYQSLVRPERQRLLLDSLARLDDAARAFASGRAELRALAERRDAIASTARASAEREAQRRDALEALRALAPKEGELEALERERALLANVETVRRAIDQAHERLVDRDGAALDLLRGSARELESQAERAPELGRIAAAISVLASELASAGLDLVRERDRLDADPVRLQEVEERIDAHRDLARRLARGNAGPALRPADLPVLWARLEREEREQVNPEAAVAGLDRELVERARVLERAGEALRRERVRAAKELEGRVHATLVELGLKDARVAVVVEPLSRVADAAGLAKALQGGTAAVAVAGVFPATSGLDRVEVTFASAPGARPGPLGQVASGGELARTCLALKRALAEVDDVPLLVFDEVDQNVGGRLGSAIGRTLRAIAASRQVLAISHLPTVAAYADEHHLVEKSAVAAGEAPPRTTVRRLSPEDRVREMAVMIRGEPVTPTSLEQARELVTAARGAPTVVELVGRRAPAGAMPRPRRARVKA